MSGSYEWPIGLTLAERFAQKTRQRDADDCWPWTAVRNQSGYGMINNGGRMALAHRVAWVLHHRQPVPTGLHVLHNCDNPRCVNPAHLKVGTNADNMRDKAERGRSSYPRPDLQGERHHFAKLTWKQVGDIRSSALSGRELAEKYGVCPATITNVRKGKVWRSPS